MLVSFPPLVQAQLDFGDAPATYQTLLPGGARHTVVLSGPRMGSLIDPEADGQPGAAAQGDDGATLDDEDGVTSPLQWEANTLVTIQITVNKACRLDAWVDWRGDTSWGGGVDDTLDQIALAQPLQAGVNTLSVFVPPFAVAGVTYARFRVSTTGGLGTGGLADDGEVEDYPLLITAASLPATPTLEVTSTNTIRWQGNPAYSSQLEHSPNLINWNTHWLPEQETAGVNEVVVEPAQATGGRHFYRLVRSPLITSPIPLPPPGGESTHQFLNQTFVHDGIVRRYRLKLPNNWTPTQSWPLVLLLPGHGATVEDFWGQRGGPGEMLDIANTDGWILCFAEAISGDDSYRWFTYNDPNVPVNMDIPWLDDYGFLKSLTTHLMNSALNIDSQRVFMAGFSNGGNMAHYVASKADHPFAAFAMMDSGVQYFVPNAPTTVIANRPLPVKARPVLINNQIDSLQWPYEGFTPGGMGAPSPGAFACVARWGVANGVSGASADLVLNTYSTGATSFDQTHTWTIAQTSMHSPVEDLRPDQAWIDGLISDPLGYALPGWTHGQFMQLPLTHRPVVPPSLRALYPQTIIPDPDKPYLAISVVGTWSEKKWTPSLPGSDPNNEIVLITFGTGGHNWPEADGPWDGNRKVLEFFAAHPLPSPP
ncbi:MAG: hypothetical protein JNN17_21415 [Verrucomicrobiaceae bacterium]|nr:hypothetical protein [Verrucomicrobiaceae bacterium]